MFEYNAIVTHVTDSDTIKVLIDLGFNVTIKQVVRLARIDGYEKTLRNGQTQAEKNIGIDGMNFLKEQLLNKSVVLKTYKEAGKFGRYIADVYFKDVCINDELVLKKYAIYKDY